MITQREVIELDLSVYEPQDDYILMEGDVDRSECSMCEERMGLPDSADEWDVCKACPVMKKMNPEMAKLLEEAGL